jgi:hypothetical protein
MDEPVPLSISRATEREVMAVQSTLQVLAELACPEQRTPPPTPSSTATPSRACSPISPIA